MAAGVKTEGAREYRVKGDYYTYRSLEDLKADYGMRVIANRGIETRIISPWEDYKV